MADSREKLLLEMYRVFWDNISRASDSAWKALAAYAALFAGLSFVYSAFGATIVLGILIPFSFMSIALALNANHWFIRNVALVGNVEREFLYGDDFGVLLPESWKRPKVMGFFNDEIWWVHILVYLSVCCVTTLFMLPTIEDLGHQTGIILLFVIFAGATLVYGEYEHFRFAGFERKAPGKTPS